MRTRSNKDARNAWSYDSVSLAAWSGQVVKISFEATNDATLPTRFYIDDVSVS